MKKLIYLLLTVVTSTILTSCYTRVDAGYEGIKVNLYGSDKGVDNISMVTGAVWYNPVTTEVHEYPTFVQTVDYKPFKVNAKDGSEFIVDPTVSIKLVDTKAPEVFKRYRKPLNDVIEGPLYNYIKDAFRIQINQFVTDELVSNRAEFEKRIENQLRIALKNENFELIQLTSGLRYPESIVQAINAKNKAIQESLRVQNEVLVAKAEAEKLIVAAKAEKEANELKTQALTPAILQKMWIEKWDGTVPTVNGTNANMFVNLDKLK